MDTSKTRTQAIARRAAVVVTVALLAIVSHPAKALANQHASEDTSRRNVVLIQGDGVRNTDSMEYVINGKKGTHEQFENLKYDEILGVNWVSAENASKIFENNGRNVFFVTTRDSEEGKKVLAKVNTVKNNKGTVFSTKKSGIYEISDGSLQEVRPGDDGVVRVTGYNIAYADKQPMIVTSGTTRSVSGSSNRPHVYRAGSSGNTYSYAAGDGKIHRASGFGNSNAVTVSGYRLSAGSELSNLDNKLIIINDKEATATDLKKISAFDIDKMSFKDDDYTRDQYGDKAKNGVVYIYTKKAKK